MTARILLLRCTRGPLVLVFIWLGVLACLSPRIAVAACGLINDSPQYTWSASNASDMVSCQSADEGWSGGYISAEALAPPLTRAVHKSLNIHKSMLHASGVVNLAQLASGTYDVRSLSQYCKDFETLFVATTVCGIDSDGKVQLGGGLRSWPKTKGTIPYVPIGLELDTVALKNIHEMWLSDVMLDGDLIVQEVAGENEELRLELRRSVIVGKLRVRSSKKTTIVVDSSVVFGDIEVIGPGSFTLLVEWSGVGGKIDVANVEGLSVDLMQVSVQGDIGIASSKFVETSMWENVAIGGRVILSKVKQGGIGGQPVQFMTRDVNAKQIGLIEHSVLAQSPQDMAEAFSKAQINDSTVLPSMP
jgi:hypothetical protein